MRPEDIGAASFLACGVFVARNGQEKLLPLDQAAGFNLYWRDTMPVAIGEHLLITKKRRAKLRNGDLRQVKPIEGQTITLEDGYKLDLSKPLHVRQGYTITSQTSQSHEKPKMFAFVPVSVTSQINAVQMLVTLSRASHEARLYTDSKAVLFEAATRFFSPRKKECFISLFEFLPQTSGPGFRIQLGMVRLSNPSHPCRPDHPKPVFPSRATQSPMLQR